MIYLCILSSCLCLFLFLFFFFFLSFTQFCLCIFSLFFFFFFSLTQSHYRHYDFIVHYQQTLYHFSILLFKELRSSFFFFFLVQKCLETKVKDNLVKIQFKLLLKHCLKIRDTLLLIFKFLCSLIK